MSLRDEISESYGNNVEIDTIKDVTVVWTMPDADPTRYVCDEVAFTPQGMLLYNGLKMTVINPRQTMWIDIEDRGESH